MAAASARVAGMAARRAWWSACRSTPTAPATTIRSGAQVRPPAARPLRLAGVRGGRALQHHRGPGWRRARCRRRRRLRHPGTVPEEPARTPHRRRQGALTLDAEALYRELLRGVRDLLQPDTRLVGHHLRRRLAGRAPAARPGPGRRARRDLVGHAPRRLRARRPGARRPHPAAVRRQRRPHPAGRRRALHRPHDPRRDQRAVRLRPAGRASRSRCWSTAAAASCRCRPTTRRRASRCRADQSLALARAARRPLQLRDRSDAMMLYKQTRNSTSNGELIHLLSIEGLPGGPHADPRHRRHLRRASTTAR